MELENRQNRTIHRKKESLLNMNIIFPP